MDKRKCAYFKKILWSDESRFHNNGVLNKHFTFEAPRSEERGK